MFERRSFVSEKHVFYDSQTPRNLTHMDRLWLWDIVNKVIVS